MAAALALCAFILLGAVFVVHPAAVLCGVCAVWGLCCVGFILFGACAAWSLSSGEFILFGVHAPAPSLGRFLSCKHLVLYDLVWLSGRWNELLITVLFLTRFWCQEESWWMIFFLILSEEVCLKDPELCSHLLKKFSLKIISCQYPLYFLVLSLRLLDFVYCINTSPHEM